MWKWSLAHRISRLTDQLILDEGWVGWNIFGWHLLLQEFGGATANIRFESFDGGRDSRERMTQGGGRCLEELCSQDSYRVPTMAQKT